MHSFFDWNEYFCCFMSVEIFGNLAVRDDPD